MDLSTPDKICTWQMHPRTKFKKHKLKFIKLYHHAILIWILNFVTTLNTLQCFTEEFQGNYSFILYWEL